MRSDTRRQTVTVLAFLLTMVLNTAATTIPMGGLATNQISDQFHVYVIPAGYVFAIWGLIYTFLGAFTTWQALPRNREDEVLRSLGYLPALTGLLNSIWIVLFQYQVFVLTVPVIVALLATLVAIHLRLWEHRASLRGTTYWLVRAPWSIYLGWVTVATIANTAQTLSWLGFTGFGIEPALIGAAVLVVGIVIASAFVLRYSEVAYGWVIVWAYVGVAVKESGTPLVAVTALAGALIMAALTVSAIAAHRRSSPNLAGASAAA